MQYDEIGNKFEYVLKLQDMMPLVVSKLVIELSFYLCLTQT